MADIFEEVEEGVRQDKLTEAWQKYRFVVFAAVAVLIGGVALNEYRQYSRAQSAEANSAALQTALEQWESGDYEAAGTSLQDLASGGTPVADAAAHFLAQVRIEGNGDELAAATALEQAAGEEAASIEKLALLKAAYLKADTMSLEEVQAMLGELSTDTSAFGALALELIAAKAFEEGNIELARSEYSLLRVSPNVPRSAQQRILQALASIPPQAPAVEVVEEDPITDAEVATPATDAPAEILPVEDAENEG